ncbi:TPA: relaxase/mobilization nuclease domain-containing protein [Citrobacter freundii]|uniref:Relaxase/mobilization nuclease domain-containing protein n=1 Tax=Klebsiella pasteurii TaxID=2587529 RepID=A0ABT5CTI6_9ENTR|nr:MULTISPECIES: relaxase/mobilization nuclease domain-containing protein [Enterobacteriaceae]HED1543236.1 relaxase/mobilization nuclease domain-containing protein [Kluyvera cryocrescens]MDC0694866.1 relaxase/mobilization nuclease domain-containing protein [Klebsiella pasteurii]MDC0757127.1 relaxase/mobilization nuclease domain-containing protein [Klebsiella pasteurii]MDQ2169826.1 relaxase/mobilization nuclease domain-containing protein [Klebsiella pasteurii]MDQ2202366.1 relaxase/mobilization 
MKGMQKIKRGKQFAGVVLYSLKPGSHHKITPYIIGGNMTGSTAAELISEFEGTRLLRPGVAKPVWHNSLRLPKGETLSVRQWAAFADDYMTRMGFTETHLRCYIMHDDSDGQHIHIIANRINMVGGKLYLGKNENLISTRIISELEKVHKLTQTTPANSGHRQEKRKPSRNELMMAERTTTPCPKSTLQSLIDNALTGRPDLLTFITMLEKEGVNCKPNIALTGKMNGFSFQYQGIAFKASQLGKKYGWSYLQTLIDFVPEHLTLLKQAQKPILPAPVPVPVPVPSCESEEQAANRETILEKIHQLEEKIRLERQQETVGIIQLRSKLHNTTRQIPRQRRLKVWLLLLNQIVVLLRRRGMSLLHATTHPFRKILHLHLLAPVPFTASHSPQEQSVRNNQHHTP